MSKLDAVLEVVIVTAVISNVILLTIFERTQRRLVDHVTRFHDVVISAAPLIGFIDLLRGADDPTHPLGGHAKEHVYRAFERQSVRLRDALNLEGDKP